MKRFLLILTLALTVPVLRAQNPICPPGVYIADPTARVAPDGKMYIYGSLDESPDHYCSKKYHVLSSPDLQAWTLHRDAFSNDQVLYAPDLMRKDGTFYLYYDTPDGSEYVAVGDRPEGPFRDGVRIEGPAQIDPNIFVDDDGQAYYFWGQFSAKGAKMNSDLKTLDLSTMRDSILTERAHGFHEGSYVIKRGEWYYYLFADISRNQRPTCLGYAMAKDPFGPYEYKGVVIDNAGCDPEVWNNHGSLVQFGDRWYVLYHRSTHGSRTMRKACIEPIRFNADGTIDEVEMTSQGAGGPLDAFSLVDAARACGLRGHVRITRKDDTHEQLSGIRSGDQAVWKYLEFKRPARRILLGAKALKGGTVLVRADGPDGPVLGTVRIPEGSRKQVFKARIRRLKGVHALWLEFRSATTQEEDLFELETIRFSLP